MSALVISVGSVLTVLRRLTSSETCGTVVERAGSFGVGMGSVPHADLNRICGRW
jgi:hypothetical protein